MYASKDILRFLDGSISGEEAAELLHRLSVSPERRDELHSYMKQQELTDRDRDAINVPYAAEQKLWAQLNTIMPAAQTATTAAVVTQTTTRYRSIGWVMMGTVALVSMMIGFGSGFFMGNQSIEVPAVSQREMILQAPFADSRSNISDAQLNTTPSIRNTTDRSQQQRLSSASLKNNSSNTTNQIPAAPETSSPVNSFDFDNEISELQTISSVETLRESDNASSAILIAGSISPTMTKNPFNRESYSEKSFLQRWEFVISENLGKQYPDDGATSVSYPVITNSSLTALYQPMEDVNLWVGATVGSLNVSKKHLTIVPTPGDPGSYDPVASLSHVQSEWYGASLQYRFPIFNSLNLTSSVGIGGSSLGLLSSAEIGTRFDITQRVGISLGMRYTNVSYDLEQELNDLIASGVSLKGVGVSNDLKGTINSQNLDAVLGIYFHF